MDKDNPILQWVVGTALLLLILYGLSGGFSWLLFEVMNLTPRKLAVFSLCVIFIPLILTIVLLAGSSNAGNSTVAYYTIFLMPFGVLGLVVTGIWALIK